MPTNTPFIAGPTIKDPASFVGRKAELNIMTRRMSAKQPTSLNIYGERRIGKSSLLYHFTQTWEQRIPNSQNYVVVYLDLQEMQPRTENDFYHQVATALRQRPKIQQHESLWQSLYRQQFDRDSFANALKDLNKHALLPVLCLDEFEMLFHHTDQFNDDFYNKLRALMNLSAVMLILASHKPVQQTYKSQHGLTSRFFNVGQSIALRELTEAEAKELVRLPADDPALGLLEQELALEWGGCHPYLLQLAALALWDAQQEGHTKEWAHARFQHDMQAPPLSWRQRIPHWLRRLIWDFPRWLGSLPLLLGRTLDDTVNWLVGCGLILVFMALLIGILTWQTVASILGKLLGIE